MAFTAACAAGTLDLLADFIDFMALRGMVYESAFCLRSQKLGDDVRLCSVDVLSMLLLRSLLLSVAAVAVAPSFLSSALDVLLMLLHFVSALDSALDVLSMLRLRLLLLYVVAVAVAPYFLSSALHVLSALDVLLRLLPPIPSLILSDNKQITK